jgi:hypothetical protein
MTLYVGVEGGVCNVTHSHMSKNTLVAQVANNLDGYFLQVNEVSNRLFWEIRE